MTDLDLPRVAVCGFGRCGSSMLMRMLDAGGIHPADGARPWSYEHESLGHALAAATPGTAVKLLDVKLAADNGVRVHLTGSWNLIWLDRDPRWQAESFRKFAAWAGLGRMTVRQTRTFRESLVRDRAPSIVWLRASGNPLLILAFEDVLLAPFTAAEQIARFMPWAALDTEAMAAAVHTRPARARADMAFEENPEDKVWTR